MARPNVVVTSGFGGRWVEEWIGRFEDGVDTISSPVLETTDGVRDGAVNR